MKTRQSILSKVNENWSSRQNPEAWIIVNATVLTPLEVQCDAFVVIRNGRIALMGTGNVPKQFAKLPHWNAHGNYIAPGLIDLHIHGALGRDAMEASDEAFEKIARYHLEGGTSSICLTTVTDSAKNILKVLDAVAQTRVRNGSRILGVHIEGPYFSPAKRGCHDPKLLRRPDPIEYAKWLEYAEIITQISLAPELEGSIPLIKKFSSEGIIVSGAHTSANGPVISRAIHAGMSQATHLFNCMSTSEKVGAFRIAGFLETALGDDRIHAELIADLKHVEPALLKLAFKAKGTSRLLLISDAMAGAGLKKGSMYKAGGSNGPEAIVGKGAGFTPDQKSLAGSTIRMLDGVRNMVSSIGVPVQEALQMATLNPARRLGLDAEIGSISPGATADLIELDAKLGLQTVWKDGRRI